MPTCGQGLVYGWRGCLTVSLAPFLLLVKAFRTFGLACLHLATVLFICGLVTLHLAWTLFIFDGVLFIFGLDGLHLARVLSMFGLVVVHIQFKLI